MEAIAERPTALVSSGSRILWLYCYLQGLDVLTTLAFLMAGVKEANPLVRALIVLTGDTTAALIAVKLVALLLGVFCWRSGKTALLRRAVVFFALLIAWNLFCLILGLQAHAR